MASIFIDGEHGTTGLEIRERLGKRADLAFIRLGEAERKDPARRREALNDADIAILCLPDEAAKEAVAMAANGRTRIIDASTAHRTVPGWVYGFPEMTASQAQAIAGGRFVTNPGCYPTGAIALLRPLIAARLLPADFPVTINAVSGYSGGGKTMIAAYEDAAAKERVGDAFRLYALGLQHKHVEEMRVHALLAHRPLFMPSVARTYRGMVVSVPLPLWSLPGRPNPEDLRAALAAAFAGCTHVRVLSARQTDEIAAASSLSPLMPSTEHLAGTDDLELAVFGNGAAGEAVLVAMLDNLGKGAAGQAVQCLDLMLGHAL